MANKILKLDRESYKREEKGVFHGTKPEILKYIQTLICFANHLGGEVIVREVKKKDYLKSFFDSAVLEKKINSYIDPPLSGIIGVEPYNKNKGVKIKIKKSSRSPHFYKTDGYFINSKKEKIFIFQRGSIGIRRSGQNDIFNSQDFENLFKERFSEIFKDVQEIVTKQPMVSLTETMERLKAVSSGLVNYRYNPEDSKAVVIKQILDTEPYSNISEELNASVKSWKTSGILLNENVIAKSYLIAENIKSNEWIELLLRSGLEKQMPSYIWASKLKRSNLEILLKDTIKKDLHPSTKEAIKLTSVLPYSFTKKMLNIASSSRLPSVVSLSQKISNRIDLKDENRIESIKRILYGGRSYAEVNIDDKEKLKEIIDQFLNGDRSQRQTVKHEWRLFDLLIYGKRLIEH